MKNGAVGKLTAKIRENKREDGRNCPVGSCWWEGGKESRSYPVKGKWDGLLRLIGEQCVFDALINFVGC